MIEKITTQIGQQYHCRDCLTPFWAWPGMHPGDQYCEHCNRAMGERIAIARVRFDNLEEMGFTHEEAEREMYAWLLDDILGRLEGFERQDLLRIRAWIDTALAD